MQILAVSEPMTIAIIWIVTILLITLGAIWKYPQVGPVLQLWAAMGTITGAMGTYFFTREQVQRQESQIKMYQTALQASENEKAKAGKQVWQVAANIKPHVESPQFQHAIEELMGVAAGLSQKIPVGSTETATPKPSIRPSPSAHATPDTFYDLFKRNTASPSPP